MRFGWFQNTTIGLYRGVLAGNVLAGGIVETWNTLDRECLYGEVVTYAIMGDVAYTRFASNYCCY